jgi:tape measure domain-containing protein
VAQANVKLTVDASQATRALQGVQNRTNQLTGRFNTLKTAIAGAGLTIIARQAVNTASNFQALQLRLKVLTSEFGEFAGAQELITKAQDRFNLSIVEATRGVTDIFARLRPLGISLKDIETTFIGFNTIAKLAGLNATEASAAFTQLAQGLGSGRLQGDEFRSIAEQVPQLLKAISDETGIASGKLKDFASKGLLRSDIILRALAKSAEEGANKIGAIMDASPAEVFKEFNNAVLELQLSLGTRLLPAILKVTKATTALTEAVIKFIDSPIAETAAIFAGIAFAIKGVSVVVPAVTAGLAGLAVKLQIAATASALTATGLKGTAAAALLAAGGITRASLALVAFKAAIATTGIGLLVVGLGAVVTKLVEAAKEQRDFNEAIAEGDKIAIRSEMLKVDKRRFDILRRLATAEQNNNKRAINSLNKQLKIEENQYTLLRDRLHEEIKKTNEIDRTNKKLEQQEELIKKNKEAAEKLKEAMIAVGEEIEGSIKNNLRDAITGTQSFGQAMSNVLNKIRDKIIDAQIDKLLGNFGESFGARQNKGGLGGFLGNLGSGLLGGLFKANGGPVKAGQSYIVGERQPELFVPRTSGTILPSVPTGGGGTTNNMITVNVDATGSSVAGSGSGADQLGQLIGGIVQQTLVREQRAGGLLNR